MCTAAGRVLCRPAMGAMPNTRLTLAVAVCIMFVTIRLGARRDRVVWGRGPTGWWASRSCCSLEDMTMFENFRSFD
jgi:hypothetical protein